MKGCKKINLERKHIEDSFPKNNYAKRLNVLIKN